MSWQSSEIGRRYDLGLATPDGAALSCLNKDGKAVQLSSLALVTTNDLQQKQTEKTNLTRLQRLVQMSSPNLLDRQFDDWPQVSQGDWSGGIGQKVYGGGATGATNMFWDGPGLIWPSSETVPVEPLQVGRNDIYAGAFNLGIGPVGGWVAGSGGMPGPGNSYAYTYTGPGNTLALIDAVGNVWSNVDASLAHVHGLTIGAGAVWYLSDNGGGMVSVYWAVGSGTNSLAISKLADIDVRANAVATSLIKVSAIGNHIYVAAVATDLVAPIIHVYQVDSLTGFVNTTSFAYDFGAGVTITDLTWQGNNLVAAITDNSAPQIVQISNFASPSFSQLAQLPGYTSFKVTAVGAVLFILALNASPGAGTAVDIYTLTGGTLNRIGPLNPIPGTTRGVQAYAPAPLVGVVSPLTSWGPYALFAVSLGLGTGFQYFIYAYDTVRSALFLVAKPALTATGGSVPQSLAAVGACSRTYGGTPAFTGEWGIVYNFSGFNVHSFVQTNEMWFGCMAGTSTQPAGALIQTGCDLMSGIIDLTSAANKNFRQVQAEYMPQGAGCSVTLNAWLDKDPSHLGGIAPDFTVSTAPGDTTSQQLILPVNQMARKLVYEVIVAGPANAVSGGAFVNAAQLLSVEVQVSVGWVWEMTFDLSPAALTNTMDPQDYCFQAQGVDHVVAYNFLRQLYRHYGGRALATFANQDSYTIKIQNLQFDSPKPFGSGFRSDQQQTWQMVATAEMREDV